MILPDWRDECRYGLYAIRAGVLVQVATCPSASSVGVALVRLAEDALESGAPVERLGVLDGRHRRWIVPLWEQPSERAAGR